MCVCVCLISSRYLLMLTLLREQTYKSKLSLAVSHSLLLTSGNIFWHVPLFSVVAFALAIDFAVCLPAIMATHTPKHIERILNGISITIPIAIQLKEFCLRSLMLWEPYTFWDFVTTYFMSVLFQIRIVIYLYSRRVCPFMFVFVLVIMLFLMCLMYDIFIFSGVSYGFFHSEETLNEIYSRFWVMTE